MMGNGNGSMLPQLCIMQFGDEAAPTAGLVVSEVAGWEPRKADDSDFQGTIVYLKNGKVLYVPVAPGQFGVVYLAASKKMADCYWEMMRSH
jgi:repressor of nif and glnA expression